MKPNFFIIGAPKCGTTALSEYLRNHPNVFFSNPKEPYFFCQEIVKNAPAKTLTSYADLFANANSNHIAVGEGSVYYLYSAKAIRKIFQFAPDAKIVIMLRNPVEMIYSLYSQFIVNGTENTKSFEEAWRLQDDRLKGRNLPSKYKDIPLTQYGMIGKLGIQVKRVYKTFAANQIRIIFYEDFKDNTLEIYKNTLSFLSLQYDHRTDFPVINANKKVHSRLLIKALQVIGRQKLTKSFILLLKQRLLKSEHELNIYSFVKSKNFNENSLRESLSSSFQNELKVYFKKDIELLGDLTGRNLKNWIE